MGLQRVPQGLKLLRNLNITNSNTHKKNHPLTSTALFTATVSL